MEDAFRHNMQTIKQIFIGRDNLTEEAAAQEVADLKLVVGQIIDEYDGDAMSAMMEIEDMLREEYGLEPDYIEELIFNI